MLQKIFYIGIGGSLGAISRFLIAEGLKVASSSHQLPIGTFVANIIGCALIGLLGQVAVARGLFSHNIEAMILTGFIGSLTTFSTFSNESVKLFVDGAKLSAALYVIASMTFGIIALIGGSSLASVFIKK
jgi:CrcB protein